MLSATFISAHNIKRGSNEDLDQRLIHFDDLPEQITAMSFKVWFLIAMHNKSRGALLKIVLK